MNIEKIANEINIGLDSLVFIDDNAMERNIVESQLPVVAVPNIGNNILDFIDHIEGNAYFETVSLSADDINRNKFYSENRKRASQESVFENFDYYYRKLAIPNRFDTAEVIFIKRLLQVELKEDIRERIVDSLFKKYIKSSESDFAKELYLNEIQIKEMLSNGMHIGSHGYNHYWWNKLKAKELEEEIDLSLSFLDQLGVNLNNWTAAYPYGSHSIAVEKLLEKKMSISIYY